MLTETTTSLRAVFVTTMLSWIILATGAVNAATIASFADPTAGMSPIPYLFEIRDGAPVGTISQPANAPNVVLSIDPSLSGGGVYSDVTLSFSQLEYTGGFMTTGVLGPGHFEFIKDSDVLLRVDFDSAYLTRWSLSGDDIFGADDVQFTVMGEVLELVDHTASFSFSFANQTPYPGLPSPTTGFDATASFMCSAVVIPEPALLILLATGGLLAMARRR